MCGIAGIYRFDGQPVETETLERMKASTVHRGPDDSGVEALGPIGLAHNRLSIIDLSAESHQPMTDVETGNWIVFNGEIYNYKEIRAELEAAGYHFHSTGDTEVILHAYRRWGAACLDCLNGMFAFAILDAAKRELFLARDRLGIKPLYYYFDERQFVFASETKAILVVDGVPRRIDRDALPEFVAFRYLANGRTLFENIHELRPGCCIRVGPGGPRIRRYWDIQFEAGEIETNEDWIEGFREELTRSVRYQLIADVRVGCALSGGVDSSLVTALAVDTSMSAMETFTIGFDVVASDERSYARRASEILGVENHSQVLTEDIFWKHVPRLIWHMDEPINHPNSVGIWLLAKLARPMVTVLLTGEGGDELMGGYSRFQTVLKHRRVRRLLPASRTVAHFLPVSVGGRAGRVIRELRRDDDGTLIWSSAYMPSPYVALLFGPDAVERAETHRRSILNAAPTDDPRSRHLYLEQKTYMASLLIRNDKMTMAEGLEGRVPFLDHHVVEYAARVPGHLKYNQARGKILLMTLAQRRFGLELFNRPKSGFPLPASYFLGDGMRMLKELVCSRSFRDRELMDQSAVEELIRLNETGVQDLSAAIWILAGLELWARTFIDQPGVIPS